MEQRSFGATQQRLPVIGQGTWQMEQDDPRRAMAALRRGLDLGMGHIDTAEMYGDGRVEELVAEAIAGRRAEVFLASKVLPHNASRQGTLRACERSLQRLRTDHLDLYLLHWPGPHPLEETIDAFEQLVQERKILSYGVSNFDVKWLDRAVSIAGSGRIACNQVLYHLQERDVEHALLPRCQRHGVALVAYSPFGSGDFPAPQSRGGRILTEVARAHGATPRQVALRFLLRESGVFMIPKTASTRHVEENAGAGDLTLSDGELVRLAEAFPLRPPRDELPSL